MQDWHVGTREAECLKGVLVKKSGLLALRLADRKDVWLSLNPLPMHLVEEFVEVTGSLCGRDAQYMSVRSVRPAGMAG